MESEYSGLSSGGLLIASERLRWRIRDVRALVLYAEGRADAQAVARYRSELAMLENDLAVVEKLLQQTL